MTKKEHVLSIMEPDAEYTAPELANTLGSSAATITATLSDMVKEGTVVRVRRGVYTMVVPDDMEQEEVPEEESAREDVVWPHLLPGKPVDGGVIDNLPSIAELKKRIDYFGKVLAEGTLAPEGLERIHQNLHRHQEYLAQRTVTADPADVSVDGALRLFDATLEEYVAGVFGLDVPDVQAVFQFFELIMRRKEQVS